MFQTIQISRAVAAALVMLAHVGLGLSADKYFGDLAEPLRVATSFGGDAGVAFFFVLSGFLISHVHRADLDRPSNIRNYLGRRIRRLYPTYWIIFSIVYCAALLTPGLRNTVPHDPWLVLQALMLIPQAPVSLGGIGAPVILVAWTLHYEILFYLVFCIAFISSRAFGVLVLVFMLGFVWEYQADPNLYSLGFISGHLLVLFCMGMLVSLLVGRDIPLAHAGAIAVFAGISFLMAGVVSICWGVGYSKLKMDMAYGAISALLIFSLVRYEASRRQKIRSRIPGLLGDSSYALYLMHYPLISVLCKISVALLPKTAFAAYLGFFLIVVACMSAALVFHVWIEKPLLRKLSEKYPLKMAAAPTADTA